MSKFTADLYVDDLYVKTFYIDAQDRDEAEEKLAETLALSVSTDLEELDSDG